MIRGFLVDIFLVFLYLYYDKRRNATICPLL